MGVQPGESGVQSESLVQGLVQRGPLEGKVWQSFSWHCVLSVQAQVMGRSVPALQRPASVTMPASCVFCPASVVPESRPVASTASPLSSSVQSHAP